MNYKYSEHQIVKFSNVDFKLKLGIVDACQITQNMVTDFFRKYDFDNSIIASRNNAVLVVPVSYTHLTLPTKLEV